MKRYLKLLLLMTLIWSAGYSQQYQRMLIPADQLNITLPSKGQMIIDARCLDQTRKVPIGSTSLKHVITGSQNVNVQFLDNYEIIALSYLLEKGRNGGIVISGVIDTKSEEAQTDLALGFLSGKLSGIPLQISNYTGRILKISSSTDIQVGETAEVAVETFGGKNQDEIWANTSLHRFQEFGIISESELKNSLSYDLEKKVKFLESTIKKFEVKNGIPETGNLNSERTKETFNYQLKIYSNSEEIVKCFSENDIGVKGANALELINDFKKAENISDKRGWKDLEYLIKSRNNEGAYYLFDEKNNKYIRFLKSKKISGLLFRYSYSTKINLNHLENALFQEGVSSSKSHILNFLSRDEDAETYKTLTNLFPNNHSDFTLLGISELKKTISQKGVEYLFCLGHFEDGKIFTIKDGKKISYDIKLLNTIAEELGVKIFFLGCQSSIASGGKTGTTIKVNSIKILNILFEALNTSDNLGDFLNHFASNTGGKYSFTYDFDEKTDIGKIRFFEKKSNSDKGDIYVNEDEPTVFLILPIGFPLEYYQQDDNGSNQQSPSKCDR